MDCICPTQTKREGLYARLFAKFYDRILASAERESLGRHRESLLGGLSGRILEIGCGTGVNFSYYSSAAQVTALEPSASMMEYARQKAAASKAEVVLVESSLENFSVLQRSGKKKVSGRQKYDAVVATLVLCTVPELQAALGSILDLLKEGGRLVVLEHIRSHKALGSAFQAVLRPVWKCCGQGCILNRPTDLVLQKAPSLRPLEMEYFSSTLPFFRGIFEYSKDFA